eukprot:scaffold16309_cov46-Attheya_sp.AAC.1
MSQHVELRARSSFGLRLLKTKGKCSSPRPTAHGTATTTHSIIYGSLSLEDIRSKINCLWLGHHHHHHHGDCSAILVDMAVICNSRRSIVFIESTFDTMVSANYCVLAAERLSHGMSPSDTKNESERLGTLLHFPCSTSFLTIRQRIS